MTTPDILQMSLDAKALKFVSEFLEKERLDRIRISELISLCGPRIKNQRQKYNKMKELNWVTGHNLAWFRRNNRLTQ